MSMKKKQVRRTEGYKNKHEGNRGNEHCLYVRVFPGMSLAFICFMLLFGGIGVVNASVTYDAGTNTIFLESGTNTIANIYTEIGDPSVLSYDSGTNTYTLSAYISGKDGVTAHLHLKDTTLIFDNSASNKYRIKTHSSDLVIENMTIENANPSYPWLIWVYARWESCQYTATITDSDISGGHIIVSPNGYIEPRTPIVIKNNKFHDITIEEVEESVSSHKFEYILGVHGDAAINAYIYNNTFENCHLPVIKYNGMMGFGSGSKRGLVVDKIYISNCSTSRYGMIYFKGSSPADSPTQVSNIEIKNCCGNAFTGKEYGNVIYSNVTITNLTNGCRASGWESVNGVHFYYSYPSFGMTNFWVHNVTIDGADRGVSSNGADGIVGDIYNVKTNNVNTAYRTIGDVVKFYITNSKATNYNTKYEVMSGTEIREYQLADIYVVDTNGNGNPIETATVTIEAINPDVNDCIINRKLETLTQTATLSNGHTPLPAEDETNTVALLSRRVTHSTDKTYTYTITAEKDGYTAVVTVAPDESWYREDPNTCPEVGKGTVIITLPLTSETGTISGTVKDTNGGFIANATVSDGTRSATSGETGVYTLTDVPSGTYTVTSTKTGYQDASVANVAVSEEAPAEVDLTLEDTFSPYTSGISPAKAATGVSRDTNIVAHIIDDGSGVDQSSIVMTVEGTPVTPTITGTANDYTVTYTPPTPFEYEQVVDVTIAAQDLATPANVMTTESYAFTILSEQQSLTITNVNVASITTNSATITWATNEEADTKVTYDTNPASLGTVWKNNSVLTKTHSISLTGLDDDKTYYYEVYSTDASENTANSIIYNFITLPVLPGNGTVLIQAQDDVTDNRLKEASPGTVLGSSNYIDVGRISSVGNYRDVIWFDLSQLNSTDSIKTAKLSLFWYYVGDTRNSSTTVEIYRSVAWAETYVTWNSRTDGVAWNIVGGDWYDKNIVAQGNTPYAAVTLPLGAPDNAYHEFDVTELVQSYVDGTFDNTGFFIKANEVSDSYIAFRSSDWTNADERPKLVVSYSSGDAQQNTLSGAVTSPDSAGIAGANVTLATLEGTVINTTQTDSNGNYSFTEISAGTYNLTVTKPRFWPAADNITVTTGNTENVMLWLKGDLNLNGTQADSGDLLMMGYAATGGLTPDWKFDLNGNGEDACAGDLLMLEDAAAGKIELW